MGYYDPDVYNQPEKFGLTLIDELNDPRADYDFDIFAVWKHEETGKIYWANDAGCSCPSPFEDYTSLDDLHEVESVDELIDAVAAYFNSLTPWPYDDEPKINWETLVITDSKFADFKADCVDTIRKIREA